MRVLLLSAALAGAPAFAEHPPPLLYDEAIVPRGELLRDAPAPILPAQERDTPSAPETRAGWAATPSSLLLYDSSGTLISETGLGRWEEEGPDQTVRRRTVRGGASKSGRFAWSWENAELVRSGRSEKVA
ncbi:MAG: hypothetical protein FD126_3088, partial [Elusimicrobia bacterium]